MRELHDRFAGVIGQPPPDYLDRMTRLMDFIEAGDDAAAVTHVTKWFTRVDAELVGALEGLLALAAPVAPGAPGAPGAPEKAAANGSPPKQARKAISKPRSAPKKASKPERR
ncbi:MAG: hypothetical protein QM820_42325 [Minicystis sp.]